MVFADPAAFGRSGLGCYDLDTGERLFYVDLSPLSRSAQTFANDTALDADGNVYVTDSFGDAVYRVTPSGHASVLVRDSRFDGTPVDWLGEVDFGLGGVAYERESHSLLVGHGGRRELFRLALSAEPVVAEVIVANPFAADGFIASRSNAVYSAGFGQVLRIESDDRWATANVTGQASGHGPVTTLAWRGDELYALYAYIGALFGTEPPPDAYQIVKITDPPVAPANMP